MYKRSGKRVVPANYNGSAFQDSDTRITETLPIADISDNPQNLFQVNDDAFVKNVSVNQIPSLLQTDEKTDLQNSPRGNAARGNANFIPKRKIYNSNTTEEIFDGEMPMKIYRQSGSEEEPASDSAPKHSAERVYGGDSLQIPADDAQNTVDSVEQVNDIMPEMPEKHDPPSIFGDYSLEDIILIALSLLLVSGSADDEMMIIIGLLLVISSN